MVNNLASVKASTKQCTDISNCGFTRELFQTNGYPIKECTICKHRYTNPKSDIIVHINENYDDNYFFGGKTGYPNYLEEKDILISHGERYAKIINKIQAPGRILDVGAAAGFLLQGFINEGWNGKGIEPNQQMVNFARENYNLEIEKTTLEDFTTADKFDLVTLIQVIGHFHNIDKSISNVSNLLSKNGLVLVESWNMNSFYAKVLGKNWHEYSPPTVLHWFSKETLKNIFLQHGFIPVKTGIPVKKISLKHAASLLKEKYASKNFGKIFMVIDNLMKKDIKIIYPPIDIFWVLFKKEDV